MSASARCLCGKVTFEANEDIKDVSACHCEMCRRWTGGPMLAAHLKDTPTITGEDNITWFKSSDWAERGFCSSCGTSLFYRLTVGPAPLYMAAVGAFDDQSGLNMDSQIFIEEKPSFYDFAGDIPSMTGEQVFAMFAPSDGTPDDTPEGQQS